MDALVRQSMRAWWAVTAAVVCLMVLGSVVAPDAGAKPVSATDKRPMGVKVRNFKELCGLGGGDSIVITDDGGGKTSATCDGGDADGLTCTYTKSKSTCDTTRVAQPSRPTDGVMASPGLLQAYAGLGAGSDQSQTPAGGSAATAHPTGHKHHKH